MLQHYSHIRSQAKQAAIRALEEQAIKLVLPEHGQRIGQSDKKARMEKLLTYGTVAVNACIEL